MVPVHDHGPWRSLIRRTGHLLAVAGPTMAGRGVQFLGLAALAVMMLPAEYGRFAVMQALVVGVASILGSTTAVAVNAATARAVGIDDVRPLVLFAGLIRQGRGRVLLIGAAVSALIVPAAFAMITASASTSTLLLLCAIGAAGGALPVNDMFVAVLAGRRRYRAATTIDACRALIQTLGAMAGALAFGAIGGAAGLVVGELALALTLVGTMRVVRVRSIDVPVIGRAQDGISAGVVANVVGLSAGWAVMWGIQLVGGAAALGAYGVATRFASIVTLAPTYFGKTVVGQLAAPDRSTNSWTPRSYVAVVGLLSLAGSCVAFTVYRVGVPQLRDTYVALDAVVALTLLAMSFRAVLISVGHVCVARQQWTLWVVADVVSFAATAVGLAIVVVGQGSVVDVVGVSVIGNAAGVAARVIGLRRAGPAVRARA